MARHEPAALYLQDLLPGDEWESLARTVTEADVVNFAGVSGDFNPLHVDHEAARATSFGRPIAHGLLGMAIAGCARRRTRHQGSGVRRTRDGAPDDQREGEAVADP